MAQQGTTRSFVEAPTRTVAASEALLACRELGPRTDVALVLLTHLGANLDVWGPRIDDGLAQEHLIAVDYRDSTGRVLDSAYPDSGHGVVFHYREFADTARGLLHR